MCVGKQTNIDDGKGKGYLVLACSSADFGIFHHGDSVAVSLGAVAHVRAAPNTGNPEMGTPHDTHLAAG